MGWRGSDTACSRNHLAERVAVLRSTLFSRALAQVLGNFPHIEPQRGSVLDCGGPAPPFSGRGRDEASLNLRSSLIQPKAAASRAHSKRLPPRASSFANAEFHRPATGLTEASYREPVSARAVTTGAGCAIHQPSHAQINKSGVEGHGLPVE